MIIKDMNEIKITAGGRVDFSIGGGASMFELRRDQEVVITIQPDGNLRAEVRAASGVFVDT